MKALKKIWHKNKLRDNVIITLFGLTKPTSSLGCLMHPKIHTRQTNFQSCNVENYSFNNFYKENYNISFVMDKGNTSNPCFKDLEMI